MRKPTVQQIQALAQITKVAELFKKTLSEYTGCHHVVVAWGIEDFFVKGNSTTGAISTMCPAAKTQDLVEDIKERLDNLPNPY